MEFLIVLCSTQLVLLYFSVDSSNRVKFQTEKCIKNYTLENTVDRWLMLWIMGTSITQYLANLFGIQIQRRYALDY